MWFLLVLLFFEWAWTYVVLFCLIVGVHPQFLGDDKNAILMHFGVKTQIRPKWTLSGL